jgi:hypothetical protein
MRLTNPVEVLYLYLMLRWERSAPPESHEGLLDDVPTRNTQKARMTYLLQKVAAGAPKQIESTFQTMARFTRRQDGRSYISKDQSWMEEPCSLWDGWYLEGCTNMSQKETILQWLTKLGLSQSFADCAVDFVAGKSVEAYMPTEQEAADALQRIEVEDASRTMSDKAALD